MWMHDPQAALSPHDCKNTEYLQVKYKYDPGIARGYITGYKMAQHLCGRLCGRLCGHL